MVIILYFILYFSYCISVDLVKIQRIRTFVNAPLVKNIHFLDFCSISDSHSFYQHLFSRFKDGGCDYRTETILWV